jgi:hypothetical protein
MVCGSRLPMKPPGGGNETHRRARYVLGGGDLAPGPGFHGNYASFNLKDRPEVIHVNLDKFDRIQELLARKIRSAGASSEGREPLRLSVPAGVPIELWDSGLAISAHAGDTLQTISSPCSPPHGVGAPSAAEIAAEPMARPATPTVAQPPSPRQP